MAVPGSRGEHKLQKCFGTTKRAEAFYNNQVLDYLNPLMQSFIAQQEIVFIATADAYGECDCSFRAGSPGFVHVLDKQTILYPEYRGNGVVASLGNITENPHIGMIFIDFFESAIGLHVNGSATILENAALQDQSDTPNAILQEIAVNTGQKPERWVRVAVEEAYIHCSKHIPLLEKRDKTIHWGSDDITYKGGDYFQAKTSPRPWQTHTNQTTK